ncbi:MAG: hypothetical protein Q9161_002336 [Pseudevernia consocians]
MTSVTSDDSPPSQSPATQRSKSGSKSTNSRHVQELPAGHRHNDIYGEGYPAKLLQSDDQSRSAYIQDLQRTIDALRAQQGDNRDRFAQPRRSHLSGEGDERHQVAHGGEDRIHPGQFHNVEEIEKGWKLEIKRWKRVNNRNGFSDIYDESEKIEDIRKRERYVLSVYDEYDVDGKLMHVLLAIHSPPLLDLLRQVITFFPGDEFDILSGKDSTDDTVTFMDPYMIFFAYRAQLRQTVTDAKLTEIEEGRCRKISYDKLFLLYPPNTAVYACKGVDDRQIVVYSRSVTNWNTRGPNRTMKLTCWEVTFEGGNFKRDFSEWNIEPYSGEKNISNLELVPVRYMENEQELYNKLVARGRRYFEFNRGASLQDYYGDRFPRVYKDEPVRVVVDEDTYWRKYPPSVETNDGPSRDYGFPEGEEELVDHDGQPLEATLLRCFPEVGVFSMRDKEWALVKVDDLKPVRFREKAFRRLVIREDYKRIIKAMVEAYRLEKPGFSDIVSGKGRGLTILLHGPPGTGKTLTAECVAEKQKCPLFTISCGDLGTEPEQLEVKLKEVFEYAVTWKAILLLDEADIFLQERDVQDVKRNALVSIFLRELEYFDGILFLTTNRPGDIDEAFVSRIHITLGLNSLTREEQRKIWTIFIKDLDLSDAEKRTLLVYVTDNFGADNLNGRQIRNTVRTALALAQLGQQHVTAEHLEQVVTIGREYAGYVNSLNRMGSEEYAVALGKRAPAS